MNSKISLTNYIKSLYIIIIASFFIKKVIITKLINFINEVFSNVFLQYILYLYNIDSIRDFSVLSHTSYKKASKGTDKFCIEEARV